MYSAKLFLGLPINDELTADLDKIDPKIRALFIKEEDNYLQEIIFENTRFLGKGIYEAIELNELEMLEINIYSLLKKLVPHYSFEKSPLVLFPFQDAE